MWILLLVITSLGTLALALFPLLLERPAWSHREEETLERMLEKEKERVLRLLKDLDLERDSRALAGGEYDDLRRAYLSEAALINRKLEACRKRPEEVH